jgi:hypothetical protein
MFSSLARLHEEIAAVCPIDTMTGTEEGVEIAFRPEATPPQRAAAQAVVDGFDWSDAAHNAWLDDQEPLLRDLKEQAQQAIDNIDAYLAIADTATNVQVRAEVKAIDQRQRRIIRALVRVVQRTWR